MYRFIEETYGELRSLGDNTEEIRRLIQEFARAKQDGFKVLADAAEREEAEKAEAAYREAKEKADALITDDIRVKFDEIGVIVKANVKDAELQWKRRVNRYDAMARWWFQDKVPFQGALYEQKKGLKNKYSAKFTKNWNENPGAWWHVDSGYELDEILTFLS